MAEAKDPAIKLFGKTIPLPDTPPPSCAASCSHDVTTDELSSSSHNIGNDIENDDDNHLNNNNNNGSSSPELDNMADDDEDELATQDKHHSDKGDQDGHVCNASVPELSSQSSEKSRCQESALGNADLSETLSGEKSAIEPTKAEDEKTETSASQEKTLKKPDKILPCPRCNSMDTKFCYYNNYNVNQPRHFCKNCQRYWTAGGTMRNVPVGAGRRKNKSSASQFRHITVPEALQNVRTDTPNGVHPGLQPKGTVLTFGSDAPLCESMASILNLAEKTMRNGAPNGCQKPENLEIPMPFVAMETGGNHLEGSHPKDDACNSALQEPAAQNCLPFPQIPCYPGALWPYPWNSAQWSPTVGAPPFCPNGLALPFYPAPAYWGCTVPGTWSIPIIAQPSTPGQLSPSSSPNSPTLGKHSRDGNVLTLSDFEKEKEDTNCERSLWIPKTLRIDDPGEAAKSSIWTTLGLKNTEKPESVGRGSGLFRAFNSKCNERTPSTETSPVLEANPAALSRSQNFQENS